VLDWGAKPKDLDSYLNIPDSDPAKRDCVINYKVPRTRTRALTDTHKHTHVPFLRVIS
jgi:hypothetical protein